MLRVSRERILSPIQMVIRNRKISIGFIVPSGNPFPNKSSPVHVNKRSFFKCVVSAILSSFPLFTTLPLQITASYIHRPFDRSAKRANERTTGLNALC